jgi:hypothetical protein
MCRCRRPSLVVLDDSFEFGDCRHFGLHGFGNHGGHQFLEAAEVGGQAEREFGATVSSAQVVGAGGTDRTFRGSKRDSLVGYELGDLHIRVDAPSPGSGNDLAVGGSDALPTGSG